MKMYVAGIRGMVGSAISEEARMQGFEVEGKGSAELDLTDRKSVFAELSSVSPDFLIIAAARVGGIGANIADPVGFLSVNLQIQTNLLDAAHEVGIKKVLFLGSSCIYPRNALQPITESQILTGELEPTNLSYALAKIAGLKLVEAYRMQYAHSWISAMPTNLYGPRDNFDLSTGHALPALIQRFHLAHVNNEQHVTIWGDGSAKREFLHVQDLAKACIILLKEYDQDVAINLGSGQEVSILELAEIIKKVTGFLGEIKLDTSKPNGMPRKLLENSRITSLGWKPEIDLYEGIESTYKWFVENSNK
jgi:GDP-L-fucose synthase